MGHVQGGEMALSKFEQLVMLVVWLLTADLSAAVDEPVDYTKQVKPLLRDRCYACHGALKQAGGLRLDTVALMLRGSDAGIVVARDVADESVLLKRIASADLAERMPPEHEGEPFTVAQVNLIRRWIASGATGPVDEAPETDPSQHWAYQPIVRPSVPPTNSAWVKNPVDAYLELRHRQQELLPQPEASSLELLRRLYIDLVGVPPSLEDITAFENNTSPQRYEQTVEQLLDDPRHGERWARHWMDIWRYSDWWGLGDQLRNSQKHIWHWRDWIIESLNEDLPYDEMVRQMLAADELYPSDLSKLRATGYLARNYFLFNRPQWMEETVEHVSKGFLGLTMNCAKCHDHKFDPFEQDDFYRMRAFFEPYHVRVDMVPGEADFSKDGIPRAYDRELETPTYRYIRGDEKNADTSSRIPPAVPKLLAFDEVKIVPVMLPTEAWQPERRAWVAETLLAAAGKRIEAAELNAHKARENLANAQQVLEEQRKTQSESTSNASNELQHPSGSHQPLTPEAAVADAQSEMRVAETALAMAQSDYESIQRRAEAQAADPNADSESQHALRLTAIRAERLAHVAKASHAVALAEQTARRSPVDKKDAADKALKTARESLEQALTTSQAEIKATDQFTRLVGAQWTPTRFLNSGKDDPAVEFAPKSSGRRTALANWITDRRNPLTARVAANHIWTRHLGQPLVPTVFDFGRKGIPPAHPQLLDWLAAELVENDWSMKHLHRLIVNSATYRMSSSMSGAETKAAKDPENHFLWRRVPIRIESQVVRDSLLALAGTLDTTLGGPPVPAAKQTSSTRRSLYFFHSNNERSLFLTTFDEALVKDCYRREQSIVPQQALALSNSGLVLEASALIAKRLSIHAAEDAEFIRNAFRVMLGIEAKESEIAASQAALVAWQNLPGGNEQSARSNLVWTLVNHNDFVTLR